MENKLSIKERNEQLLKFINIAEAQRRMYKGCPSDIGLTLDKVIAAGIDMEVVTWLSITTSQSIRINQFGLRSTIINIIANQL